MVLLIALFTLVLLSVIGLGLMYSTNMETTINSNYRDKQVAMYGALSGVQEARDRLQPAAPHVTVPTELPTLTNHMVIYIINPKDGETVAPWDMDNDYKDTELCQEGILGLTPTPGAPCAELPSGDDWYTVIDNTDPTNAPWNLTTPTDTKWTRITLKGNAMTPVPVDGHTTTTTQTCWEGKTQMLRPVGYGTNCWPDGSLVSVKVVSGGTGYTTQPTVTIAAPPAGGIQAVAEATIEPLATGQLESITIDNVGAGYETAPTVEITGGGGTGATATATIVDPGSPVASVSLTSAGQQCYASAPAVSFTGAGSGAAATATLEGTASCVVAWTVTGACSSRKGTTVTGVGLSGAAGSGFSGSVTFKHGSGAVTGVTIQNPGTGYTSNPTNLTNLTGCGSLTVTAVTGYRVAGLSLTAGGSGYSGTPIVGLSAGAGSAVPGPTATATVGAPISGGTLLKITLNNPGSGYTTAPVVTLVGGGLGVTTTAAATAHLAYTNTVTGFTLTNAGLGYRSNPTVNITGGGGTGATARASRAYGSDYGRVYLVTSMAQTRSGAKAMSQGELASPVIGAVFPAALTFAGPEPTIEDMPHSAVYHIDGSDRNSCSELSDPLRPAIGGWDNPDDDPPTHSVDTIVGEIPTERLDHYTGLGDTPSVTNVYGSLGETFQTPWGLKDFIDHVAGTTGAYVYGSDPGSINLGSAASPAVIYVDGNLNLSGNPSGYGILVVTGTLRMTGNFQWHGIVMVVGDGKVEYGGGGNPEIDGTVFVAKIWDNFTDKNLLAANGSPSFDWNGGGGNGIYYDHCWVQNLIPMVEYDAPPSTRPLKILSTRTVSY